jgi:hypothetical protein
MEYKKFAQMISALKDHEKKVRQAYKLGIDIIDVHEGLQVTIEMLLEEVYGKDGVDWISWFRFESDYGKKDWSKIPVIKKTKDGKLEKVPHEEQKHSKHGAHDENGNPICYSVKSTWEYLEENYNKKHKGRKQ